MKKNDPARAVLDGHKDTINARDNEGYLSTMNFPFTYQNYNGVAVTFAQASDCGVVAPMPWDIIMDTNPNWSHSVFDTIEEVARSVSSVVYIMSFRRIDTQQQASTTYDCLWIATCQKGHWGIQFRHNLGQREA